MMNMGVYKDASRKNRNMHSVAGLGWWKNVTSRLMDKLRDKPYYDVLDGFKRQLELEKRSWVHIYHSILAIKIFYERYGEVTLENVRSFLAGSSRTYYGYIKKFLKFLALYDRANRAKYLEIYNSFTVPSRKMRLPETLTREQVKQIIELAEGIHRKTVIAVLYETGVRVSELLNIRAKDIESFEYGFKIRIVKSKSIPRTVLVVEYAHLLSAYLNGLNIDEDDRVFPFDDDTVRIWLRKIGERMGIRLYPHLLRHSRATHLYGKLSEKEMMLLFGWRKRDMLDVYARVVESDAHRSYLSLYGIEKRKEEDVSKPVKCPRCGQLNPSMAEYCYRCGYPLREEKVVETVREETELLARVKELEEKLEKILSKIEG